MCLLKLENITKTYTNKKVLERINLELNSSEIHLILGENGVGKSTLVKIIAGLVKSDSGHVNIKNEKDIGLNVKIGFMFDEPLFLPYLTVHNYLDFVCVLARVKNEPKQKILEMCKEFNLLPLELIKNLSTGNKKKLEIIAAFLLDPQFLVFDEPFLGLDLNSQEVLVNKLKNAKNNKKGILLVSNSPEILIDSADKISIINSEGCLFTYDSEELYKISKQQFTSLPLNDGLLVVLKQLMASN